MSRVIFSTAGVKSLLCLAMMVSSQLSAAEPCKNGRCPNVSIVSTPTVSSCQQCSSPTTATANRVVVATEIVTANSGKVLRKTIFQDGSVQYQYADDDQPATQIQSVPAIQQSCPNGQCPRQVVPQRYQLRSSLDNATNKLINIGAAVVTTPNRMLNMINEFRAKNGVPPLVQDDSLQSQCLSHSARQSRNGSMFHDHSLSGGQLENVGYAFGYADPDSVVLNKWINSPPHRAALLKGSSAGVASVGNMYTFRTH